MVRSFWAITATLLGVLTITSAYTQSLDYKAPMMVLGAFGTISAGYKVCRPSNHGPSVAAATTAIVWAIARVTDFYEDPTASWFGVLVIWTSIVSYVLWGREMIARYRAEQSDNAHLRRENDHLRRRIAEQIGSG